MLTALWCICTRYCGGGCTIVKPQRHLFYKRMAFKCYVCGVQVYVYMYTTSVPKSAQKYSECIGI